jgi:hypothetical protein
MKRTLGTVAALAAGLTALLAAAAQAETIAVDDQVSVRPSDVARPARGMTMKNVEAKFGAPQERHPAVGQPPITRWDYPAFSVFFEHEFVIDAVVPAGA